MERHEVLAMMTALKLAKLSALALSYGLPRRPIEPTSPCWASSLR